MLNLFLDSSRLQSVLFLGAHCDDIEIGCGGTAQALVECFPKAHFHWVTLSSDNVRRPETEAAAARFMAGAQHTTLVFQAFRGSYFPSEFAAIKNFFETLKSTQPDLIFTHYRYDLHQDHRVVNELTWNTFRNHLVVEYEIPKFDGDLGAPNAFVPLTAAGLARKCDILLESFRSQSNRSWFARSTFEAIARLRGVECNAPEGYAEAFYLRKTLLGV